MRNGFVESAHYEMTGVVTSLFCIAVMHCEGCDNCRELTDDSICVKEESFRAPERRDRHRASAAISDLLWDTKTSCIFKPGCFFLKLLFCLCVYDISVVAGMTEVNFAQLC